MVGKITAGNIYSRRVGVYQKHYACEYGGDLLFSRELSVLLISLI